MKKPKAAGAPTIHEAINDPQLFGPMFSGPSWLPWRAALKAIFPGVAMTEAELAIYRQCTQRYLAPVARALAAFLIAGRRAGKSIIAAVTAVFLACFVSYPMLVAGEVGTGMLIAADRAQARVIFRYIVALLELPLLRALVIGTPTMKSIRLRNLAGQPIEIEIHTASWRSTRGYTIIFAICDEVAAWRSEESGNPDTEILNALKPGMLTTQGLLLVISSPYAKRGALWDAHKRHFGREGDPVLVWQASTETMHPPLAGDPIIAAAYEDDPVAAAAEYGALFRSDVQSFVDPATVHALVVRDRASLPWSMHARSYVAFADMAGGSGQDSATLGIAHYDFRIGKVTLDLLLERRPPFSPEETTEAFALALKSYGIRRVIADKFAGDWPTERFQKHGIAYEPSAQPSSVIYAEVLPLLNSGDVELLDNPRLVRQLCDLDRRPSATGTRDQIAHPKGAHDDLAVACCGALLMAAEFRRGHRVIPPVTSKPTVRLAVPGDRGLPVTGIKTKVF